MKTIKVILILFIIFLANNIYSQTTRYVNPDGLCGGNSPCYTTIQLALTASVAGDIIMVNPGTYTGNININKNNITLISTGGAASTIINGNGAGAGSGTIYISSNISGIRIGAIGQGFKIIGIDGTMASEKAALYLSGTHANIIIEDNIIEANGDAALMGVYNADCNNVTINKNQFTGQTFTGANPAGVGFSAQYTLANVPRQAIVFGGGTGTTVTRNFTFTNNVVSTVCGGMSIKNNSGTTISPTAQGNCIATLDLVGNNVITGNTFNGTIGNYASSYALRVRGTGTYTVQNNIFNGSFSYALFSQNSLVATNNYWGSNKGPNIFTNACPGIKAISFNVTYEPWYNDVDFTSLVYKLAAYTVSGSTSVCNGTLTNVTLSNTQNGNNYQYQLYLGGSTAVGTPITGNGSLKTFPASAAGTYTIKATNTINNCVLSMSGNAIITNKTRPTANISGGTNSTVNINVTGTGPWNGMLSSGDNFSGNTNPITVNVTPTGSTTYTIASLTDANCSSINSDLTGSHTIISNVETVVSDPPGGTYYTTKMITLTCATNGAQIKYTTDGTIPNETNGNIYTEPFLISENTTLKTLALKSGMTNSDITSAYYHIFIDTDNDGVVDGDDQYPNDPLRAFNIYFPANKQGTLAFEDSWPNKGDNDMNDIIVDYRFKTILNASNKIVETYATFTLRASGASYNSGFGFQLANANIINSDINAAGYIHNANYITVSSNGTEANQTKPTFIVFDNAFGVLHHPGGGSGINTSLASTYVNPVDIVLHITYSNNSYTYQQLDISHFNPFIIVNKERGREVHLSDYTPTSLANPVYFGTYDDKSNASQNKYYKTINNLPWALNIYESFDYPTEKTPINEAYPKFIDWVISEGTQYPDWYKDISGNRDANKIYKHLETKSKIDKNSTPEQLNKKQ